MPTSLKLVNARNSYNQSASENKISSTSNLSKKTSEKSSVNVSSLPGNFDPNPFTVVDRKASTEFRWNGPGYSKYPFIQYVLCFEYHPELYTNPPYVCLGLNQSNHKTMTEAEWETVFNAIKADLKSRGISTEDLESEGLIELQWHVQSRFVDITSPDTQEMLSSDPWVIYLKLNSYL